MKEIKHKIDPLLDVEISEFVVLRYLLQIQFQTDEQLWRCLDTEAHRLRIQYKFAYV